MTEYSSMGCDIGDPLLHSLLGHGVDFVVIGGHAVCHHGFIRTTEDLDVVVDPAEENLERLLGALGDLDACWISDDRDPLSGVERSVAVSMPYVKSTPLMMLCTRHGPLDVFTFIPGFPEVPVRELFATARTWRGIRFVSLPWLIRMKERSGRAKDIEDIKQLRQAEGGECQEQGVTP